MQGNQWQRRHAEDRIREVLDAAKNSGPQSVVDTDGHFEVKFHSKKQSLEDLFAQSGPIQSDGSEK